MGTSHHLHRGFSLIELLVVVGIIGMLSSLVLASMAGARAKARDAQRMSAIRQMSLALQIYYDNNNAMPVNHTPCCGYGDANANFVSELTTTGFLSSIPRDPRSPAMQYYYYDYGPGNSIGAILVTTLEAAPPSTTGYSGTCRPWGAGQNWCDQSSNRYFCICHPY